MLKLMLACCKVYISESRNKAALLESIEQAAKLFSAAIIVNKFEDVTYNRVGYTVVSKLPPTLSLDSCPLKSTVFAMVKAAFENIDPGMHSGSHPRLGVVDHICFHPLASAPLDQVARIAKSVAGDIGSGLQGFVLQSLPFLYARGEGRTLDSIRRELGYFKPNSAGNQWAGGLKSASFSLKPDKGPDQVTESKVVIVIGSTRWVDNYTVPVFKASERGGGLASVQAMALTQGEDITEVACNLLKPSRIGGDKVQLEADELAAEEGVAVGKGYYTDLSQEKLIELYMKLNSPA
ncbi:Folic acid binding / transferase [Citrus sinensis]|uniref:Folic acid binding / transferase n=1 Tax=Citrus sinensis TaxID=2711 RepID=A0ACB8N4V7_CITSI|nr:Folic acid binding / transferase [Citrus sinensis]